MFPVHLFCVQQLTSTDLDNSFTPGLRLQVSSVVGVLFPRRWSSLGSARSLKPPKKKIQSNYTETPKSDVPPNIAPKTRYTRKLSSDLRFFRDADWSISHCHDFWRNVRRYKASSRSIDGSVTFSLVLLPNIETVVNNVHRVPHERNVVFR